MPPATPMLGGDAAHGWQVEEMKAMPSEGPKGLYKRLY